MIELSWNQAFMIYLLFCLASLLTLWLIQHFLQKKKKLELIEDTLHVCEYCQTAYLEDRSKAVTRCPHCKSFNKNNPFTS